MEDSYRESAKAVLQEEANALLKAGERLDENFDQAVKILAAHKGKIVVSGMGKSGYIAQKIVATLTSTGVPAVFLHPAEALHGDIGIYAPGDPTILISRSGSTEELVRLLPFLKQFQSPIIAILGNKSSPLARQATLVLDASIDGEADYLKMIPTTSTLLALAIGDALACVLMKVRGFNQKHFARFHPAGQLGKNLSFSVQDLMRNRQEVACVQLNTTLKEVVITSTQKPLGLACVVDEQWHLLGLITDGDLRRGLQKYDDIRALLAQDIMNQNPLTIPLNLSLVDAINFMEKRKYPHQISVLPVVDDQNIFLGVLRQNDIYGVSGKLN